MKTADFDYYLPEELIAQTPSPIRDRCKMLVLDRKSGSIQDKVFGDVIDYLKPGDLLIANETRVIPARLLGSKRDTGGASEILLLRKCREKGGDSQEAYWEALVRPGKRLKPGSSAIVDFADESGNVALSAEIVDWAQSSNGAKKGERLVRLFTESDSVDTALHRIGHVPLPPYIRNYAGDTEMYQTVYSKREGSAAAPTAGLHFTPELIRRIEEKGVGWSTVELQVGVDTFRVVDEENAEDHKMHTELYSVSEETVRSVIECKESGGRVVAVGTTSVRSLESAAALAQVEHSSDLLVPACGERTSLYIMPGYDFKVVDSIITNFHVPRSTLMMLVSAFAGLDSIMSAYAHAIKVRYRMLSFGDAMLII